LYLRQKFDNVIINMSLPITIISYETNISCRCTEVFAYFTITRDLLVFLFIQMKCLIIPSAISVVNVSLENFTVLLRLCRLYVHLFYTFVARVCIIYVVRWKRNIQMRIIIIVCVCVCLLLISYSSIADNISARIFIILYTFAYASFAS